MTAVTDKNILEYQEDGATLVQGAFGSDWIERLTQAIEEVWAQLDRGETIEPAWTTKTQNPGMLNTEIYGGVELRNVAPYHAVFKAWIEHSPAAQYVSEITGAKDVRFWMDSTFVKAPETGQDATPWHTDGSTYPFWGEQLPTMWVALTDVDEDNAPMVTLTGSHRYPNRFHSGLSRQDIALDGYVPWQVLLDMVAADDAPIKTWPAKAGDMLIFHPQMIHASKARNPNVQGRRIGFSTRWIGSDAIWQPDAYAANIPLLMINPLLKSGEAPPEGVFPEVYRAG
ncbi:MAG: phytanoyl-CoA dioxygenase family protein [Sphingomonadales bacterium]